jgi:hypothetical protein
MWFPGAEFQRHAAEIKAFHRRMRDRPFEVTQANMVSHFMLKLLEMIMVSMSKAKSWVYSL